MFLALFLSVLATSFGGLWFTYQTSKPLQSEKSLAFLISITTGLLTGILFLSFLPHSLESNLFHFFMLGGFLFILLTNVFLTPYLSIFSPKERKKDHTTHHYYHHHLIDCSTNQDQKKTLISSNSSCSIIGCISVCCFFDGFELKSAFTINDQTGWITGLSLFFHILPDGILFSSLTLSSRFNKKIRYFICLIPGLFVTFGFSIAFILEKLPIWTFGLIPFSTGILFYIVFTHLIPIALRNKLSLLWFCLGTFVSLLIHLFSL